MSGDDPRVTRQRRMVRVMAEDAVERSGGSPLLVAFGYGWISAQSGRPVDQVRVARHRGEFDLYDLRSVLAWVDRQRARNVPADDGVGRS